MYCVYTWLIFWTDWYPNAVLTAKRRTQINATGTLGNSSNGSNRSGTVRVDDDGENAHFAYKALKNTEYMQSFLII